MHQRMGKPEQGGRISKNSGKSLRKTLLGGSTLAVIFQASLSSSKANGSGEDKSLQFSASTLFSELKEANKIMVKGAKLHESLSELRLSGWINPYTLLLVGPSEDMKIVKNAWVKRHLKSPQGYFIKDIGIVRDCIVEMIQQSPFMSLTTALFEAVADLNHQRIFPTKDTLFDYLRKQYPEIETPDTKVIHDCLGRLIKSRRLYHNGRGYFILLNENVLNEVITLKSSLNKQQLSDTTSIEPSIVGFKMNDSRTSSSGQTEGNTDIDSKTKNALKNRKRHDSIAADTLTEVSTIADVGNISELNTPRQTRTLLGSRLFRKNNIHRSEKSDKKNEQFLRVNNKTNNSKKFSCGMMGTATDSVILANDLINTPNRFPINSSTIYNDSTVIANNENFTNDKDSYSSGKARPTVIRSKSFSGKTRKERLQEVSFALVGSPNDKETQDDTSDDEDLGIRRFHRSHSFGAGYSKNKFQRPQFTKLRTVPKTDDLRDETVSSTSSPENSVNQIQHNFTFEETEHLENLSSVRQHNDTYEDLKNSFVDDSVPVYDSEVHLAHHPDMLPIVNTADFEMLHNYKDLGSAISLPRVTDGGANFNVLDLLSPTKGECLAEELKQAYRNPQKKETLNNNVDPNFDTESIDLKLLSPRSRRRIGAPYESQYINEVLNQSEQICQALEDSKKDKNANFLNGKPEMKDGKPSKENGCSGSKGVKLRTRTKSTEEKKRNQKERNSQLFEEKRASLKVMGMV